MNEQIKDGGSAFPSTQYVSGISPTGHSVGMTLRDYFAAKALQAIMTRDYVKDLYYKRFCDEAYRMADEMLKAREK
jgi:hypothetical protein